MVMRLVIQRVSRATVSVDNKVVGEVGKGLFVLLGVADGDNETDVTRLVDKVSAMRIMSDPNGKMNLNIIDVKGSILVVSQFTLIADTGGGNRPSFIKAAKPDLAEKLYDYFISLLKEKGIKTETGKFGTYMNIHTELDGPVTIILES